MDDSLDEPKRPPSGPPKYLPRIKYEAPAPPPIEDEEESEDAEGEIPLGDAPVTARPKPKSASSERESTKKSSPKKSEPAAKSSRAEPRSSSREKSPPPAPIKTKKATSKPKPSGDGNGQLVEQTPEGETFEGRRRARLMVGGVAGAIVFFSVFSVWRSLRSDGIEVDPEPPPASGGPEFVASEPTPAPTPEVLEAAARKMLADARQLEKTNKSEQALALVERVVRDYANTPSAKVATAARERYRQGLPLFVEGAAVIADRPPVVEPITPQPENPAPSNDAPEVVTVAPSPVPVAPTVSNAAVAGALPAEPRRPIEVGIPRANVAARALSAGFHARPEAGVHPSGWPREIVCNKDGGTMMLVPGDQFVQGRDDGQTEERPAHRVQLSTYYIDQHEVTSRQFGAYKPGSPVSKTSEDSPVVNVSLIDARGYAQWAGKRIPTEAQWEMAARATDGRFHPWGNDPPDWDANARKPKQIVSVMQFPGDMSPYGVFDLAGNAWEWTNDWFDTKYYSPLKGQTTKNPTGPSRGVGRIPDAVIKGGSRDWDAAWRSGMRPDARLAYLGFRCVLNVDAGMMPGPENLPSNNAPPPAPRGNNTFQPPGGGIPF